VHEKEIEIRWRDLDAYGHVNHAVFATYLEEARDEWLERALGRDGDLWDYVVARVAIDYRRELRLEDDRVRARCGLDSLGRSSVRTREAVVVGDGQVAAEAEAVLVARDPETQRPRPLTDSERARLEAAA
jgi:acyl-CoA thioester hydrolase